MCRRISCALELCITAIWGAAAMVHKAFMSQPGARQLSGLFCIHRQTVAQDIKNCSNRKRDIKYYSDIPLHFYSSVA